MEKNIVYGIAVCFQQNKTHYYFSQSQYSEQPFTIRCLKPIRIHRLAQDSGRRPFRIKVGIAAGKSRKNLRGSPPATFAVLRLAEGLVDHLHQIDGPLIRHILFNQHLYLVILQPEPFSTIKLSRAAVS